MQTFLPYADFAASAAVLDERRLGKQRVETMQILRALTWPSYRGWKNHPATAMWRGFVPALAAYGVEVCREWERRGHPDAVRPELLAFSGGTEPDVAELAVEGRLPPWLGFEPFHLSHRSALVRKSPEHYRRVFGDVPDDLPYVWPSPAFPRWPVWRAAETGPAALPPDVAQATLGLDEVTDEQRKAVDALRAGEDVVLATAPDVAARAAGLVAGLCLPGPTLWVTPHVGGGTDFSSPPLDELRPAVAPVAGGRLAVSMARPPARVDVASMRREGTSPTEFVFHRPESLRDPAVRRAVRRRRPGLVVVEHADRLDAEAVRVVEDVRRRCGNPPLLSLTG